MPLRANRKPYRVFWEAALALRACLGHLEIINASDVLNNAVAKYVLVFTDKPDSSWPAGIYTLCYCVA